MSITMPLLSLQKTTLAEELAAFVASKKYEDISMEARQQLKNHTLDAIGCALGALNGPPVQALHAQLDEFGGKPLASLIGGGKTAPDLAAYYNCALERYLDFMDSFVAKNETCHPADNVMAVLAAAEYAGASGATFLTALAIAYQVQCRLSEVAPVRPKGFDHTTQGAYAVAAGVAKALDLDRAGIANAVAISGASYVGLRVTRSGELSNWKGLAYPNTAYGATGSTFLAKRGVTGPLEVFEGKGGLMDAITGKFELDWSRENLEIVRKTNIKKFNAEFHAQTAMEAAIELRAAEHLNVANITAISVDIFDVAFDIIGGGNDGNKQHPKTKEEADHSLPYMIAVALIDGQVAPAQYEPARILKRDVQDLLRKVAIRPDAHMSSRFPAEMPCRIQIELNTGRTIKIEKDDYEGFYTRPMSWPKIVDKFNALASPYANLAQRSAIVDAVERLETRGVAELTAVLNVRFDGAHP
jgi:2-methylcitrate dehydratase